MKFRKKPVVIEAKKLTKGRAAAISTWLDAFAQEHTVHIPDGTITIHTLEGDMLAGIGDWVIQGVQGEFYPCKPDIFASTYEPVEES